MLNIDHAHAEVARSAHPQAHLSNLSGEQLSHAILHHPHWLGTDDNNALGDIQHYQARGVHRIVLLGLLAIMDARWDVHVSSIRTGHRKSNSNPHNPWGLAVDLNNYGPEGAASRRPGTTSSTDPTRFVHWLKINRAALGHLRIGGGLKHAKWGADFRDSETHIHIDWKH